MNRREVWKAGRACAAHALLLAFTILLVLKLHHVFFRSWWIVFSPLWLFHVVVARGRFSIPAGPSDQEVYPWAPFHAVVAIPLLIAFELLLCMYLESSWVNQVANLSLKIVFRPIFLLETLIIIDNIRMLLPPTPGLMEQLSLQNKYTKLLYSGCRFNYDTHDGRKNNYYSEKSQKDCHCAVIYIMAIIFGATLLLVSTLIDPKVKDGYCLPIMFSWIGQLFVYLFWMTDMNMRRYLQSRNVVRECIGGHVIIVVILVFQILLCVYFEGKISLPITFSPLFLLQGVGVVFYASQLVDKTLLLLLHNQNGNTTYFRLSSTASDFLQIMRCGTRYLGWWSIDDEAQARQLQDPEFGYTSYWNNSSDLVKKMSKSDLVEEVQTLQAAVHEQIKANESSQREYERLREEKITCKICFERDIVVMLIPCKHRILCGSCANKCSSCPICRASIHLRLHSIHAPEGIS